MGMLTFFRPRAYAASPKDLLYCMGLIPPSEVFILPSLCPMDVFVESIHEARHRSSDK